MCRQRYRFLFLVGLNWIRLYLQYIWNRKEIGLVLNHYANCKCNQIPFNSTRIKFDFWVFFLSSGFKMEEIVRQRLPRCTQSNAIIIRVIWQCTEIHFSPSAKLRFLKRSKNKLKIKGKTRHWHRKISR